MFEATIGCSVRAARAVAAGVLLTLSASAGWASEAPVTVEPAQFVLSGESGAAIKVLVAVVATIEVDKVSFESGYLRATDDPSIWIEPESLVFKPAELTKLKAGDRRELQVSLAAAPRAGSYQGVVRLTFEPAALAPVEVPITVTTGRSTIDLLVTPKSRKLGISGLIGSSSFQTSFTLEAKEKVSGLVFHQTSLKERRENRWIAAKHVTVAPEVTGLEKGERRVFDLTVASVAAPGLYEGSVSIGHAGSNEKIVLEVAVDAIKLEPIPAALEVRFSNRLLGRFTKSLEGTFVFPLIEIFTPSARVERRLLLHQETPLADSSLLESLDLVVRLDPLEHGTRKSEFLDLENVLAADAAAAEREPDAVARVLPLVFAAPTARAEPGSYTGNLRVYSPTLGTVAKIPVEVRIRDPQWLAWILMIAGILSSWAVTYWKTTGRVKNELSGDLAILQERLATAAVKESDRVSLRAEINRGYLLLEGTDMVEARAEIEKIEPKLRAAISTKLGLVAKVEEVEGLRPPMLAVEKSLEKLALPDTAPVFSYLADLGTRLDHLEDDLRLERFPSAADTNLQTWFDGIENETTALQGLVDLFADVKEQLARIAEHLGTVFAEEKDLRDKLVQVHLIGWHESEIGRADSAADVSKRAGALGELVAKVDQLPEIVARLDSCQREINRVGGGGVLTESAKKMKEVLREILAGEIPVAASLKAIRAEIAKESGRSGGAPEVSHSVIARLSRRVRAGDGGFQQESFDSLGSGEEARERKRPWVSSATKARVVSLLLYLLTLAVLLPIGMSETYVKKEFFGGWMAYLAVFLWGFGIQAAGATAAAVRTTIRG